MKLLKNITIIDIAPSLIADLRSRTSHQSQIHIIEGDFFAHQGQYELILEQTFFCALDPGLRRRYIDHMHELLQQGGLLAGVLFNRYFDQAGPPFGGDLEEYQELFSSKFEIKKMELCNTRILPVQVQSFLSNAKRVRFFFMHGLIHTLLKKYFIALTIIVILGCLN